ncbi:MAG: rhomboid family intramembrane serine protease [Taibaiella sp.]|jgi:membrane associated rhomboid family serine protease
MSEYRPGGFQILPPVIKNLIIINVLVFAATYVLQKANIVDLDYYLALFHWKSPLFKPWQVITHIFMHANITHLVFNMFALWMFGNVIENTLGAKRILIFYFVCGFGAALCHLMVFTWENAALIQQFSSYTSGQQAQAVQQLIDSNFTYGNPAAVPMVNPMVGASGAIFGVLFAFGYLFPNLMIYVYFLFPIKAKYFVAIYAIIELFSGFRNNPTDNVAHFAHLGGMLFAFLLLKAWKLNGKRTLY